MAKRNVAAKRVVYLWGAGATHAEAQRLGSTISLLMRDSPVGEGITTRILKRTGKRAVSSFGIGEGVDIEKLISLLAASGIDDHSKLAEKMRANYFAELKATLTATNLLAGPQLAVRLLNLHSDPAFRNRVERLCGIISTNHDGLLQVASQEVFGAVNAGFDFVSKDFEQASMPDVPPVLQLHGSFTWQFGLPIRIEKLSRGSPYGRSVWIPPTILKESKSYPYNKLSGSAYELMARHCDVLRVVGTSLTQNDWNILSLIFNAQRHSEATKGEPFVIELIMPHSAGEGIKRDCAYLKNTLSIGFLTDGRFAEYKEGAIAPDSDLANPFAYWLDEKIEFHRSKSELSTPRQSTAMPMAEATAP